MHFRDSPDSLNGLEIPGNNWFCRFAVTYILYTVQCTRQNFLFAKLFVKFCNLSLRKVVSKTENLNSRFDKRLHIIINLHGDHVKSKRYLFIYSH